MKISIITATYNSESTVIETMDSLRSQTYGEIEHIIIDGLSTDATLEMVNSRSINDTKLISEEDLGLYDALNKGLKAASGDVVGFLHSDDLFPDENTISKIAQRFQETNCDAVYGDIQLFSQEDPDKIVRYWKSSKFHPQLLSKGWMPPHPSFFMKLECYKQFGGFDISFKISGDYEALIRYFLKHNIHSEYIPEVLSKQRLGGVSTKNFSNIKLKMREDYLIMKRHNLPPLRCLLMKNLSKFRQFQI